MMRLPRLLLAFGLMPLVMLLTALTASAEEQTVVFQANLTIPVMNKTTIYDPDTGAGTWSFQGTIDGAFAQAAGAGSVSGSGSTAIITMTTVDAWTMPGIVRPTGAIEATIRSVGDVAYVSISGLSVPIVGIPVAISAPIAFPIEAGTYTLTNAGSGSEEVTSLPNTGDSPAVFGSVGSISSLGATLLVSGTVAAGVAGALALDRRRVRACR
jgi:hypothetical protein